MAVTLPDSKARVVKGYLYYLAGELGQAKAEFEKAIQLSPCVAIPHNGLGLVLFDMGMVPQARQELQLASELDPADAVIRHNLAIVYIHLGEFEAARHELRRALALNPQFMAARKALARLEKIAARHGNEPEMDH